DDCWVDGYGCGNMPRARGRCGAQVLYANLISGNKLNFTISAPSAPGAFGHFTISDDLGNWHRFLKSPMIVNGQRCDSGTAQYQKYTSLWAFDFQTPPAGTCFDIWLTVYWDCGKPSTVWCDMDCTQEIVHHRDYVKST
ncbi:4343_t:CDS:2, partial [Gigaspora margarita]